jgi:hypothetical protein
MFGWLRRRSSSLSFPAHYRQTSKRAPGRPHDLTLSETRGAGSWFRMTYAWSGDLAFQEADNLDTRVRAFIASAIPDAAVAAGLACQAGPPHGQRPSWFIGGGSMPVSLVQGAFDVEQKKCQVTVGPIGAGGPSLDSRGMPTLDPMARAGKDSRDETAERLAAGFQSRFGRIRV